MKKLLFISILLISIKTRAQTAATPKQILTSYNKYLIKVDTTIAFNTSVMHDFVKQICAATSVNFNPTNRYFEVLTKKALERNIIDGKLKKNYTPMVDYIFMGEVKSSLPATNDNNTNAE